MNPTTPPAIRGETIRARRNQLGLTIKTACTTARMSTATWVTAEKGDPVTTRTATRIEQTLGWPQGTIHELDNAAADPTQLPGYQPPADTIARQLDRIEQLLRDTLAPTPDVDVETLLDPNRLPLGLAGTLTGIAHLLHAEPAFTRPEADEIMRIITELLRRRRDRHHTGITPTPPAPHQVSTTRTATTNPATPPSPMAETPGATQ